MAAPIFARFLTKITDESFDTGRQSIIAGDPPELSREAAYMMLVEAGMAPAPVSREARNAALIAAIEDGRITPENIAELDNEPARNVAYSRLVAAGSAAAMVETDAMQEAVDGASACSPSPLAASAHTPLHQSVEPAA